MLLQIRIASKAIDQAATRALLLGALVAAAGCYSGTVVSDHYETLEAARANRLFIRGWLPDILPESTTDIETNNQPEHNTSTGSFSFAPEDAQKFYAQLSPGAPTDAPFPRWEAQRQRYAEDGFSAWTYKENRSIWVFFCRAQEATCEYTMWLQH